MVETTPMSIHWWTGKQDVINLDGKFSSHKKEYGYMHESWRHETKGKMSVTKDHLLCDSIDMKCPKQIKI